MADGGLEHYERLMAEYRQKADANEPVDAIAHQVNACVKEMVAAGKIPEADAWRMGVSGGFDPDEAPR